MTRSENFKSSNSDPFSNLTVARNGGDLLIALHDYSHSVDIKLTAEEARRLAEHILKVLQ